MEGLILGKSGFDFAVGFREEVTEDIGTFQLYLSTRTPEKKEKYYIPLTKCNPEEWPLNLKVATMYCPDL